MKQFLITAWKDYGGRFMAGLLSPVLVLAVPVVVAKAQQWFGYRLTPTQARDYMLVGAVAVVTPIVLWLVNNAKFEKVVEWLAKQHGVSPAVLSAHLAKLPTGAAVGQVTTRLVVDGRELAGAVAAAAVSAADQEPADVPGV